MKLSKQAKEVVGLLDPGWEVECRNGSGHLKLRHRTGAVLIIANTPGDGARFRGNVLRDARRAVRERKCREQAST